MYRKLFTSNTACYVMIRLLCMSGTDAESYVSRIEGVNSADTKVCCCNKSHSYMTGVLSIYWNHSWLPGC